MAGQFPVVNEPFAMYNNSWLTDVITPIIKFLIINDLQCVYDQIGMQELLNLVSLLVVGLLVLSKQINYGILSPPLQKVGKMWHIGIEDNKTKYKYGDAIVMVENDLMEMLRFFV